MLIDMTSKEFKNSLFNHTAKANGFEKAFGGWFFESTDCITVLDLQKSNFGDYYELNIKIYIQGAFGNHYAKNKDLVRKDTGDIFLRSPDEFRNVLDFDNLMSYEKRKAELEKLFDIFITPITTKTLTKSGIIELAEQGIIDLLPAVENELIKLGLVSINYRQ